MITPLVLHEYRNVQEIKVIVIRMVPVSFPGELQRLKVLYETVSKVRVIELPLVNLNPRDATVRVDSQSKCDLFFNGKGLGCVNKLFFRLFDSLDNREAKKFQFFVGN